MIRILRFADGCSHFDHSCRQSDPEHLEVDQREALRNMNKNIACRLESETNSMNCIRYCPMKILVLADIHENATALEAVLIKEREFDSVIFLGDAVSPGPQPNETIELLSDLSGIFIRGNHDAEMLDSNLTANWPDGFKALQDWIYDTFNPSGYDFLRSFQDGGEFTINGQTLILERGDGVGKVRHVLPDTSDELMIPLARGSTHSPVLFGHSHIQFRRFIGEQEFINPGSIGQNRCGLPDCLLWGHHRR